MAVSPPARHVGADARSDEAAATAGPLSTWTDFDQETSFRSGDLPALAQGRGSTARLVCERSPCRVFVTEGGSVTFVPLLLTTHLILVSTDGFAGARAPETCGVPEVLG